jgi:type II secretory pathway component PulK
MQRQEEGFALVTTLWFLALVAFVAVVVEGWISTATEQVADLKQRVAAQARLIGVTDRLVLMMTTGGWSARGLELVPTASAAPGPPPGPDTGFPSTPYVALDNRPYRLGDVTVRLQDEGGLYDLSNPKRDTLEKLLDKFAIGLPDADEMGAALAAYTERPPNRPGESGSDSGYTRARLPPPRHARLLTPWEPYRVLGWQRGALWTDPTPLSNLVTVGPVGGLNVNTAPAEVLAALTGGDADAPTRIVAARTLHPITSIVDLLSPASGLKPDIDRPLVVTPSNLIRLELTTPGDALVHVVTVRLTPAAQMMPYHIDFAIDLPRDAADRALSSAPPPPPLPTVAGSG